MTTSTSRLYTLWWRVHFIAGMLITPILLVLACSGVLYVFKPQIEDVIYRSYLFVEPSTQTTPMSQQLAAVNQRYPDAQIKLVTPPTAANRPSLVELTTAEQQYLTVAINPANAQVLGAIDESQRFSTWIISFHADLRLGNVGRTMTELATSWLVVMLLTGIYLWWPRKAGIRGVWLPRRQGKRLFWRDMHGVLGIYMSVLILTLVMTGLPWTQYAGGSLATAQKALGQSSPPFVHAVTSEPIRAALTIDSVVDLAQQNGFQPGSYAIRLPQDQQGAFRVTTLGHGLRSNRLDISFDQYTGDQLARYSYADYSWMARIIGLGVSLHRGELFGVANQILIALAALSVIWMIVTGIRMWWLRRPQGSLGVPKRTTQQRLGWGLIGLITVLAVVLPVFGVSMISVLFLDNLVIKPWQRRRAYRLRSAAS